MNVKNKLQLPLQGMCHCGKIRFQLSCNLTDLKRCNCSHCRRKGFVMTTAKLDQFKLISCEENLKIYQWNSKIAKHYFCKNCGINTHHQRRSKPDEYGVNVEFENSDESEQEDLNYVSYTMSHTMADYNLYVFRFAMMMIQTMMV